MMINFTHTFRLRHALLLGTVAILSAGPVSCSGPSASVDIAGTWNQETGTQLPGTKSADDLIRWRFDPKGTFSRTEILFGNAQNAETGAYKIRPPSPECASIPGQIVECSSPRWEYPKLLRVPPHSSTLLIAVNCDDDSFSSGRPECWLRKEGTSPLKIEAAPEEITYTGTVTEIKRNKSSQSLLLDTRVHGKQLECPIIEDDVLRKLGDVGKLVGQKVEIKGKPDEHWRSVIVFVEDASQLKVIKQ